MPDIKELEVEHLAWESIDHHIPEGEMTSGKLEGRRHAGLFLVAEESQILWSDCDSGCDCDCDCGKRVQ
jgi:hypothetical protein